MKSDHITDQTTKANAYRFRECKYSYIYYAHSIALYNTDQEKLDLEFLQSIKPVLNPKDINEDKMSVFINYTLFAEKIWFRGYTAGVCLEVIVALLKNIPICSLETRLPISTTEIKQIITSYKESGMFDHDFYILYNIFGKKFAKGFRNLMDGVRP